MRSIRSTTQNLTTNWSALLWLGALLRMVVRRSVRKRVCLQRVEMRGGHRSCTKPESRRAHRSTSLPQRPVQLSQKPFVFPPPFVHGDVQIEKDLRAEDGFQLFARL